ncbi:unnamed protein product, partial [Sphagnum troendelagicum]
MSLVSDIKLIRTDTTLDLSQKAEKATKIYFTNCSAKLMCSQIAHQKNIPKLNTSNQTKSLRLLSSTLICWIFVFQDFFLLFLVTATPSTLAFNACSGPPPSN